MALATLVARACDGLLLAESRDERGRVPPHAKQQATQLLTRLHCMSPRCSLEAGGFIFHLLICDGVCYLGLFEYCYPKMLAFTFLEELCDLFREELKQAFGSGSVDHRSHIETIDKPYSFVRFDRQILRKQAEFQEPSSSKSLSKLQGSSVQASSFVGSLHDVLPSAEGSQASDSKVSSKTPVDTTMFAGLVVLMVVIMTLIMCAVTQVHAHSVVGLTCFAALVLGVYCLSQLRGGGKSPKLKLAPDTFSCVSDYLI